MKSFDIQQPDGSTRTFVSIDREDGSTITIEAVLTNPEYLALTLEQSDE